MAKKVKTTLDLDNNRIVNVANPINQLDATNKDFIDELFIDLLNIGTWKYDATLEYTSLDINTFRMNNATHSLVTNIWIHYTDLNSFVADFIFDKLTANDEIIIQDTLDSSKWVKYKITSKTDNTTYFTFVVTYVETSISGSITSGNSCKLKFIETPNVSATETGSYGITIDGSGSVITTGIKGYLIIPYGYTITGWSIIGDITGSIVFDIWKNNSAIPTIANTITASAKPTLSSQQFLSSTTLTGWTTSGLANDKIIIKVDSVSALTKVTLTINLNKL
ncbi:MAG: hypothetical protein E6R13_08610 [Spirochaetes bacterium]|nr:MAG: hypothetical protein E6R13_08610 [Spirochaetota bacterium]